MNIQQLFQCLTREEKIQLFQCLTRREKIYLKKLLIDEQSDTSLTVFQWCDIVKPSQRLYNILHMAFRRDSKKKVMDITRDDLMMIRNCGIKTWNEFVKLRGY